MPKKRRRSDLPTRSRTKRPFSTAALAWRRRRSTNPVPRTVRARRPLVIRLLESNPPDADRLSISRQKRTSSRRRAATIPPRLQRSNRCAMACARAWQRDTRTKPGSSATLAPTDVSKNLISVFYLNETLKKDPHPSPMTISLPACSARASWAAALRSSSRKKA